MNPDNRFQSQPLPEVQPTEPVYGVPAPQAAVPSEANNPASTTPLPPPVPLNTQFSVDYLNQIAPVERKSTNKFAVIALIVGVLIAVLAALLIFANSGPPDFSTQAKGIQLRIATLQTVADGQQTHLKENAISEANSTLASALTSMNTELTALMKTKGIKPTDSARATVTKTEKTYAAALTKKLDDSYQRGTLDRTYATQMTYELTILRSTLNRMKNTANSKSVASYVDSAVTNIDAILKAYSTFSATK